MPAPCPLARARACKLLSYWLFLFCGFGLYRVSLLHSGIEPSLGQSRAEARSHAVIMPACVTLDKLRVLAKAP